MHRKLAVLAAIALACADCSCRREPSPEFSRASESFNKLYGQKLDDAYLDPRMREVEALLQRVPADSLDGQAAVDLLARIRNGRARMQKAQEDTQAASAAARTPSTVSLSPREPSPETPPPRAASLPPDAGADQALQPTAVMSMAEFNRRFADCFQSAGSVTVQGAGERDSYELVDVSRCRTAYPTFTQVIVVADGRSVMSVVPKSALVQPPPPPPPPDAGPPVGTAPAPVADAG